MKKWMISGLMMLVFMTGNAQKLLIPMDEGQKDHLKAYGLTYWVLAFDKEVEWLLNYRGGSFLMDAYPEFEKECLLRGVSFEKLSYSKADAIKMEIESPVVNANVVKLLKTPKIAVYSPKSAQPWDDAVTMVLTYAQIPYDVIFDDEVLDGKLPLYDWLHLHHEDFTGQYGKFYSSYRNAPWYIEQVEEAESTAARYGYAKVSKMKLEVVKKIRDFTLGGGFLFAMCSATDSYDIALAAEELDICAEMFDGDPMDYQANSKLNFSNTLAFKDFHLIMDPMYYEYSNIDMQPHERSINENNDVFVLNEFSAKWDVVPTILTQNHERVCKGFYGQTTAFKKNLVKSSTIILGENKSLEEVRYMHGVLGKGTWTFYSGHDPEDYRHMVGEPPTDLSLHPNSPGYRLILNNILFPSAKQEKKKT
jgi:hypothetical protein